MTLASELRDAITADGPVPFEQFQARALYDSTHGFFSGDELRSTKSGDFLTSPEISPLFGETLGRFVADALSASSAAQPIVVEAGAGSGSLLRPLLANLDRPVEAWAVEASPAARSALDHLVPGRVVADWDDLPVQFDGVIIANELLDNLPVALAIRSGAGWVERWVGATAERFGFVTEVARPEVVAWCDAYAGAVPEGGMVEVQLAAAAWVRTALDRIGRGSLAVVDYGGTAEELEPRRTQGTLRTYRSHHLGPDPLVEPGATDVTVDVNFTAVVAVAEEAGATVSLQRQDDFLGVGVETNQVDDCRIFYSAFQRL